MEKVGKYIHLKVTFLHLNFTSSKNKYTLYKLFQNMIKDRKFIKLTHIKHDKDI